MWKNKALHSLRHNWSGITSPDILNDHGKKCKLALYKRKRHDSWLVSFLPEFGPGRAQWGSFRHWARAGVSTGFVPVTIKLVASWCGDLADCQVWPCKAMTRWCRGMVTCCQIARYDSWKPLSAPGQTWVKSVLHGSFRKAQQGPTRSPLLKGFGSTEGSLWLCEKTPLPRANLHLTC